MRKLIVAAVMSTIFLAGISEAKTLHLKVMFYKVQAIGNTFSNKTCQQYYHDVRFYNDGKVDHFPQQANPRFYDHRLVATLAIKPGVYEQQVTLMGDFKHNGKLYKLKNTASSLTVMQPLLIRGILSNPYCRAAYIVINDDGNSLGEFTKV